MARHDDHLWNEDCAGCQDDWVHGLFDQLAKARPDAADRIKRILWPPQPDPEHQVAQMWVLPERSRGDYWMWTCSCGYDPRKPPRCRTAYLSHGHALYGYRSHVAHQRRLKQKAQDSG